MYTINDCILIRKTDILPLNGIVETPIHGHAYGFGKSSFLGDIINSKLRKKYNNPFEFNEASKEFYVYFETKRRTIHFTINGLVSDSLYGEFNYPYMILEPLKYHINDESLKSLRVEDTYFDDDMKLSNEAILLIEKEEYLKIKDSLDQSLLNIKVCDNPNEELKSILKKYGYDSFILNNNGYVNGTSSGTKDKEMYDFIRSYAKEHNISQEPHFYSDINKEDRERRYLESIEIDKEHILYILDNVNIEDKLKEEISLLIESNYMQELLEDRLEILIEEVGLETIKKLTKEFNEGKLVKRRETLLCGKVKK